MGTKNKKMKEKEFDLDSLFCPGHNELIIKDESITAKIVDAELDVIDCKFNYDDCVEIDAREYTYLTLTRDNLERLIEMIDESKEEYDEMVF